MQVLLIKHRNNERRNKKNEQLCGRSYSQFEATTDIHVLVGRQRLLFIYTFVMFIQKRMNFFNCINPRFTSLTEKEKDQRPRIAKI